jgi:hypothetical protein
MSSDSSRITLFQHLPFNRNTRPAVAQEPWIRNTAECLNFQTLDDLNVPYIPYSLFCVNGFFLKSHIRLNLNVSADSYSLISHPTSKLPPVLTGGSLLVLYIHLECFAASIVQNFLEDGSYFHFDRKLNDVQITRFRHRQHLG